MRAATSLVLITIALSSSGLGAQEVTGSLQGRVVDASGGPQANVAVTVSGRDLMGARTARTDAAGGFTLLALPPGDYEVAFRKVGFRPVIVRQVGVALGQTSSLGTVTLQAMPVELEPLVVTADAISIDPVHTTIGANLKPEDYEGLPSDRDYRSLMDILPHVTSSGRGDPLNVAGSTGLENQYFIDGVNVTSPFNAASGVALPYNFVREVQVAEGGYEAEYGKALGARVNAVTYSGTDDFQANVFAFVSPGALAADPKALPALEQSGAVDFDIGVRVGGPIQRGRLWYSAAYNPRIRRATATIPGLGDYVDRATSHLFAGKVTWQPRSDAALVELSLFGDPTVHHQVAPPGGPGTPGTADPFLSRQASGNIAGALRSHVRVGQRLSLEGRIAHLSGHLDDTPETLPVDSAPLFLDYVTDSVSGGYGLDLRRHVRRWTAAVKGAWSAAQHTVTFGVEYEDNATTDDFVNNLLSRYGASYYSWYTGGGAGTVRNRVPTAYVQDSWRVTPRLSISPGLRWSSQYLVGASGNVAQRFPNEWQPRLGASWMPSSSGHERVFASYGRLFQQLPDYIGFILYTTGGEGRSRIYATDPRVPGAVPESTVVYAQLESQYGRSVSNLEAENIDEVTAGFEEVLGAAARLTVRGVWRHLRSAFGYGVVPPDTIYPGTPGKGNLSYLPPPKREYAAVEISLVGSLPHLRYRASYVMSRTTGNYPGLYDSDAGLATPNASGALQVPYQAVNSDGALPNDRPMVLKLTAVYDSPIGLSAGGFATFASGTPVSERGADPTAPYFATVAPKFLVPRGSAGRTPNLWDLNLRVSYALPRAGHPRLLLDLLHVGNPQRPVWLDEQHYFSVNASGAQTGENPRYLQPVAYQPPMAVRFGLEYGF